MDPFYAPAFQVRIQGLTLSSDVSRALISVSCESSLDAAAMLTLQVDNAGLRFTDSPLFEVGQDVEVYMGYGSELHPMMLGEITALSPSFPQSGSPTLTVTAYDKSHRLRRNQPKPRTFDYLNDSLIVARIAAENGLIPVVDPAPMPRRESVPQTGSDWALLKQLADRNFFQVYVHWDRLYFRPPRPQTELVVLEWGRNLISFTPRLSTSGQNGVQEVLGYDYELAQTVAALLPAISLGSSLDDVVARLGSGFIESLVHLGRGVIRNEGVTGFEEAAVLARSVLLKALQGLYEGSGQCLGMPTLRAGDMLEIKGVGKRFSGTYLVGKVTHTIDGGGYQTQFEMSESANQALLPSLREKIVEAPATNKQAPILGVAVGYVENNVDEKGLGRVQLSFPFLSDGNFRAWARIATPMAGDGAGMYFLPDIGQEVLVAFEQGELRQPLVLGSLWNGKARPPEKNDGQNALKIIQTLQHSLVFNDTPSTGGVIVNAGQMGAARKNDRTRSTSAEDGTFWNWLSGFVGVFTRWIPQPNDGGGALKTALGLYLDKNPVPSALTAKIIEGSDSVKIGGAPK